MSSKVVALSPQSPTIHYDAMCRAIAAAYEVDEVKTLMDQARAIEIYAQQSQNLEAERQACEIRLRATRRLGALLEARAKAKGGRPSETHRADRQVLPLAELGITRDLSSKAPRLAEVPEADFEQAVTGPARPSISGIIAAAVPPKVNPVDDRALWLWGRLQDFERNGLLDADPNALIETMLPHMELTTADYAPRVMAWLGRIK